MDARNAIHPTETKRETFDGRDILCVQLDATEVSTIDVVLRDSVGRIDKAIVSNSTILILVPVGDFGALPFDPLPDELHDGYPVFQQRIILGNMDVRRQLEATITAIAQKTKSEKRVIDAVGAFPRKGF